MAVLLLFQRRLCQTGSFLLRVIIPESTLIYNSSNITGHGNATQKYSAKNVVGCSVVLSSLDKRTGYQASAAKGATGKNRCRGVLFGYEAGGKKIENFYFFYWYCLDDPVCSVILLVFGGRVESRCLYLTARF